MRTWFRSGSAKVVATLAAIGCATALGYENLHNDEVQPVLLSLVLATLLLCFAQPEGPWRWALLVAVGVPISGLLALKTGYAFPCRPGHSYSYATPTLGSALSSLFVLIPAFVSVYAGAWLRSVAAR